MAVAVLLALVTCSSDDGDEVDRRLAESFLRNSPTFRFDGLPDTVKLLDRAAGDCETCVEYTFGFESSHPGYGDRTDLPLAATVTPHEAVISIEDGLVALAEIDSIWDVIAQRPIVRTTAVEDGSSDPVTALLDSPFELHIGQEAVFGDRGPQGHVHRRIRGFAVSQRRPTASSQALRRYASTWSPGNDPSVCTSSSSISA